MSTTHPTQPSRTTPLSVINLGLPRTGTKSLRAAFKLLGFSDVYHYDTILPTEHPEHCVQWNEAFYQKYLSPAKSLNWNTHDWDSKLLSQYAALSDNPCISFAPELLAAYPDAKVLLSTRDSAAAWVKSYSETILPVEEAFHYPTRNPWKLLHRWWIKRSSPIVAMVDNLALYSPSRDWYGRGGETIYEEWREEVREMCQGREFLEYNVKEGWEPLCKLLGVGVPEGEFPRLNDKAEFLKLWQMAEKGNYQVLGGWRVWIGAVLGVAVPVVGWIVMRKGGWRAGI
jgi:hypothetical protein